MNPSPRDMVHQGKINLLASVETVPTQQFPSRVVLTYAILNIAQQNFRFEDGQSATHSRNFTH